MRNRILAIQECCGKGDVLMSLDTDTKCCCGVRSSSFTRWNGAGQQLQPKTTVPSHLHPLCLRGDIVWFSSVKLEEVGSTLFFHCLAQAGLNLWLILHSAGIIGMDHQSSTNYNLSKLYAIFCCFPIGLVAAPEPTDILTTFCQPMALQSESHGSGCGLTEFLVPLALSCCHQM